MKRPTFFVKRSDRLIARLKHLFYAWRFADQVKGRVIMVWPALPAFWHQFDGTDYSPSRIFNLRQFYAEGGADSLVFLEGQIPYPAPPERRSLRDPEFAEFRPRWFDRDYFIQEAPTFYEADLINFYFKDEPRLADYTQRQLRDLYARLPHDPVVTRSLQWAKDRLGADYTALHVRRGDVAEMMKLDLPKLANGGLEPDRLALLMGHYVCRTALDEFYYPEIEAAIQAKRKIAYFSDTPGSLAHFAEKFGKQHFIDGERFKGRTPIQKAFLDFNLLIGASKIISTGSNYASFSATLGAGQLANVAVAGTLDRMEQHLYEEYLGGVTLDETARKTLRNELERQYSRRAKCGRWKRTKSLPPGMLARDERSPEVESVT